MHIRSIDALTALPLRQKVLRPHLSLEQSGYPGDEDTRTLHLGVFEDQELVGVATLLRENEFEFGLVGGFRLRGMATQSKLQGQGYGGMLLRECLARARGQGATLIWCHARENAKGFYLHLGFEILKGPYELDQTGTHYLMIARLSAASSASEAID